MLRMFALAALMLVASASAQAQEKLKVIATFSILGDVVKNVGGERIEVSMLVGPNADAHVYSPSPADARKVAEAKVVVVNGLGYEGWIGRLVKASGSKAPVVTAAMHERIMQEIIHPVVRGLAQRKIVYRGVLYAGVMITADGPKVLEFNARFGDPECQAILPRLQSDLLEMMLATVEGRLAGTQLSWDPRAAVCVVMASEGYPGSFERGRVIHGLETLENWHDGIVFHAGTARRDGDWVTTGGRVLGVTALGPTVGEAVKEAYRGVDRIRWEGAHFRRDIGHRAMTGR